jgi:hypothetical protein
MQVMTQPVAFKRLGFADLVILDAPPVYVEYQHMTGHLAIRIQEGKNWQRIFRGKTMYQGEQPLEAIPEIEERIKKHTGWDIQINREYVEAYMIATKQHLYPYTANDRRFFKGLCIDGLTVREVSEKVNLNLAEDFPYYVSDEVADIFRQPSEHILNMNFAELITLLHDNHYRKDYREILLNRLT